MAEPNLPPLHVVMGPIQGGGVNADEIKKRIPELPEQTRQRLEESFQLRKEHCIILVVRIEGVLLLPFLLGVSERRRASEAVRRRPRGQSAECSEADEFPHQ